jgi:carbamoyltransferase
MKKILGISAFNHHAAAALTHGGAIIAAAQEERFSRIRGDRSFPRKAVAYCFEESGWRPEELDAIVIYDKPLLRLERHLETHYPFAPRSFRSFSSKLPDWAQEKLLIRPTIKRLLRKVWGKMPDVPILFSEYPLSQAGASFFLSPFDKAAVLVIDGVGEWETVGIYKGDGNRLEQLRELNYPNSLGVLYAAVTEYLGFTPQQDEFQVMGLAGYGNPESAQFFHFFEVFQEQVLRLQSDGSFELNLDFFSLPAERNLFKKGKWQHAFGCDPRQPSAPLQQEHCDLALAAQRTVEDTFFALAAEAKRLTGATSLCLAGGMAVNSMANGTLARAGIFEEVYIPPVVGEGAGALGSALVVNYLYFKEERALVPEGTPFQYGYLGPEFSDSDIARMAKKMRARVSTFPTQDALQKQVVDALEAGQIVGWFQGRMEFGANTLGHRSLLADPRRKELMERINEDVKKRPGYRPLSAAVLRSEADQYFELSTSSPYRLFATPLRQDYCTPVPDLYPGWDWKRKLKFSHSIFPAVTHADFTVRLQTVDRERHPRLYPLLQAFFDRTGCPLLLNANLAENDGPLVCTPEEAYQTFLTTPMDLLVMGSHVFSKGNTP